MNTIDNSDFNWDELLTRITMNNVVPVIGQGLYCVLTSGNKKILLYQHLFEELAKDMGLPPPEQTNHAFSEVVSQYLKKTKDYLRLGRLLRQNLASLYPIEANPLLKLARIRPFSMFINTTYDHFLEHTLNSVRNYHTEVLHHTYREKRTDRVTSELLKLLEDYQSSLLFHIYGSTAITINPAYTEKDILETVVNFQKDVEMDPKNPLFQALKEKSLLFIGCGYDDWLFRFFIRTFANEPYQASSERVTWKFIGDDFAGSFKFDKLACFLKAYDSDVFYNNDGEDFVDLLFDKMNDQYPEHIIPEDEFPETAFISFHGGNRKSAIRLVSHLREDGIKVWLDQRAMKPGDRVDETILKAIDKCQVFIPLVSEKARQLQREKDNGLRYHIREWEWAYSENVKRNTPRYIIPVKIDDTDWMYDPFKDMTFFKIPGGNRKGHYEKLRDRLLEIQK